LPRRPPTAMSRGHPTFLVQRTSTIHTELEGQNRDGCNGRLCTPRGSDVLMRAELKMYPHTTLDEPRSGLLRPPLHTHPDGILLSGTNSRSARCDSKRFFGHDLALNTQPPRSPCEGGVPSTHAVSLQPRPIQGFVIPSLVAVSRGDRALEVRRPSSP
jgi:hypothetical protein